MTTGGRGTDPAREGPVPPPPCRSPVYPHGCPPPGEGVARTPLRRAPDKRRLRTRSLRRTAPCCPGTSRSIPAGTARSPRRRTTDRRSRARPRRPPRRRSRRRCPPGEASSIEIPERLSRPLACKPPRWRCGTTPTPQARQCRRGDTAGADIPRSGSG